MPALQGIASSPWLNGDWIEAREPNASQSTGQFLRFF